MKKFNQFSEDADKVAALRARQKAAVAKYKTADSNHLNQKSLSLKFIMETLLLMT